MSVKGAIVLKLGGEVVQGPHMAALAADVAELTRGGTPVVLVHGFASNRFANWIDTGWVRHLVRAGHRVIALDNRPCSVASRSWRSRRAGRANRFSRTMRRASLGASR